MKKKPVPHERRRMGSVEVTREEILAAIRASQLPAKKGFRLIDMALELNVSDRTALRYLGILSRAGRLEHVPMDVVTINGRVHRVVGYRIKSAGKGVA